MFDPLALGIGLLHLLSGERGDAMPHNLLSGERTTKHGCCQNEGFGDRIIAFYIIAWVVFSIAPRLRLRESFCIVATQRHSTEDIVHRAVEDATDGTDPGSCHPLADGTEHGRPRHDG